MSIRRVIGACVVALVSIGSVWAAGSDVADAAMMQNKNAIRTLLQQKADVNAPQNDGATALHWASYQNDVELADLLIVAGAKVNTANREGATPLSLAAINGSAAMIERLVKAGASVNAAVDQYGDAPLMFASRSGKADAVKVLLDNGANINAKETWGNTTALMWAVSEGHKDIVQLLVARGADVNPRTKISAPSTRRGDGNTLGYTPRDPEPGEKPLPSTSGGLTPLHFAARQGDQESARILVAGGAKLDVSAGDGSSPLTLAIFNGHYALASWLIDQGSDVNHQDAGGCTPLWLAVNGRNHHFSVGIPWLVTADPLDLIKQILAKGVDPNHRISVAPRYWANAASGGQPWINYPGSTAFLRAAEAGDMTLMKLLLAYGADPNIPTNDRTTALMAASGIGWFGSFSRDRSENETLDAMRLLIELGADPNAANNDGRTSLHGAAVKGRNSAVQLLVDAGGSLAARDKGSEDSTEPLMPVDYAIGARFGSASVLPQPQTEIFMRKLMAERGIEHTTSECTLRGFTCGDLDPANIGKSAEAQKKLQELQKLDNDRVKPATAQQK